MAKKIIKSKMGKKILEKTLLNRAGEPSDVADMTVFLASDESTYLTGEAIKINGGLV